MARSSGVHRHAPATAKTALRPVHGQHSATRGDQRKVVQPAMTVRLHLHIVQSGADWNSLHMDEA